MEIVKILHTVKAGTRASGLNLETYPRICVCLSLNSTLLFFISCIDIIAHLYMLDIVHTLALIHPRELLKHLNSYKRGILRRSFRALHLEFSFTFGIHLYISFY